jgi:lysophospholipase L1-like esterase
MEPFLEYDETLGWRNKPLTAIRHQPNMDMPPVDVRINKKGLRGKREYPYKKTDGKKRVIILGDSIAFGYGHSEKDTISSKLSFMLGRSHEVINAGVIAYGTGQQAIFFEQEISKYEFDVLFVVISGNDIYDSSCSVRLSTYKPYFRLTDSGLKLMNVPVKKRNRLWDPYFEERPMRGFLFSRSALFRFVYVAFTGPGAISGYNREEMGMEEAGRVAALLIRRFYDHCDRAGCAVVFAVVPQEDWISDRNPREHGESIGVLNRANARYVDLWEPFEMYHSRGMYQPGDITHPSVQGNEMIAMEIYRSLEYLGFD